MLKNNKTNKIKRLIKKNGRHGFKYYSASEFVALTIDLVFIWILINFFNLHYLVAAAVAYIIAMTIHYHSVRKHVFHGTIRDPFHSYSYFIAVGIFGLTIALFFVVVFVSFVNLNLIIARIIAALGVIPATYILNSWLTFIMPKPMPNEKDYYCNIVKENKY